MLLLLACSPPLRPASGEAAYVWTAWSPAVQAAVEGARADGLELFVLHAEIGERARRIAVPDIGPHAAVVRIHVVNEDSFGRAAGVIEALARDPAVNELQIDADVPTARLADYAGWLGSLDVEPPLTVTGLPDWLGSPDLPRLLDTVDGWTLQVHAPPHGPGATVLAPDAAADLAQALTLGKPVRIALPTYGMGLVQDSEGVTTGVVGEGTRFDGPEAWADAGAVAEVVRELPEHSAFLGVTWFRLPVAGDRWTWPSVTWQHVRAGRAPPGVLSVRVDGIDLRIDNKGDGPAVAAAFEITGVVEAFDPVGGWAAEPTPTGVRFLPPKRPIPARTTVPVGWARGQWSLEAR